MRLFLSAIVSLVLCLACGCAGKGNCVVNPITGTIACGVDVDTGAIGGGVAGGIVTDPNGGVGVTIGNTKAIDECGNVRAINPTYRQIDTASICGRGFNPLVNTARGVGSRDPRVVVREIHRTQEDLAREYHNAKVARDMIDSSMWSNFRAFWGFKRKVCPLDMSLAVQPVIVQSGPQVGEILPEPTNQGLPPTGIIPAPSDTKAIGTLENRVAALETRANITEGKLDGMSADIKAILAAVKK